MFFCERFESVELFGAREVIRKFGSWLGSGELSTFNSQSKASTSNLNPNQAQINLNSVESIMSIGSGDKYNIQIYTTNTSKSPTSFDRYETHAGDNSISMHSRHDCSMCGVSSLNSNLETQPDSNDRI